MIKSIYSHIVVLGTGKLAFYCGKLIRERCGQEIGMIAYKPEESSGLSRLCVKNGISYEEYEDKERLKNRLQAIEGKALIVSAFNTYIFPRSITENEKYTVINFHPALLPKHPGRNAEAWAIYEGDVLTGVTRHRIKTSIDTGDVLIQKGIRIDEDTTSLRLMIEQQKIGINSFEMIADDVLQGKEKGVPQDKTEAKVHYSYETPNEGILDERWDAKKISAFLRAMDYGRMHIVGIPKIKKNGVWHTWDSYTISKKNYVEINVKQEDYIIKRENCAIVLQGMKQLIENGEN